MRRGFFRPQERGHGALWIKLVLGVLSVSFVAASLLAFRYTNAALRAFYRAAAVWVGLLSFLFLRGGFLLDYFRSCAAGRAESRTSIASWNCCSAPQPSPDSTGFSTQAGRESREPRCGSRTCRQHGAGEKRR